MSPGARIDTATKLLCGVAGQLALMIVKKKLSKQSLEEALFYLEESANLIRSALREDGSSG